MSLRFVANDVIDYSPHVSNRDIFQFKYLFEVVKSPQNKKNVIVMKRGQ